VKCFTHLLFWGDVRSSQLTPRVGREKNLPAARTQLPQSYLRAWHSTLPSAPSADGPGKLQVVGEVPDGGVGPLQDKPTLVGFPGDPLADTGVGKVLTNRPNREIRQNPLGEPIALICEREGRPAIFCPAAINRETEVFGPPGPETF